MARVRYDYRVLANKIATSPRGAKTIDTFTNQKFQKAKDKLLDDFVTHPITREISEGSQNPSADINHSGLLGGYGNLFSFLGLRQSEGDPTQKVFSILDSDTTLTKTQTTATATGNKPRINITYKMRINRTKLVEATTLVWETGNSWLYQLEKGISGFGNYVRKAFNSPPSYSGGGLQTKTTFTHRDYDIKAEYFNKMLRDFVKFFQYL